MTDDLIIEAEDGPWTFPATVECLPKEAKSYAEKVCAPWKQYIRTDLAHALVAEAFEEAATDMLTINFERDEFDAAAGDLRALFHRHFMRRSKCAPIEKGQDQ